MAWTNPRWGSLVGPDADTLRGIFESLSDWTRNPSFGNATNPTVAGGGLIQVQPQALSIFNEWIQSANFVSGSAGWQIKADGNAEFNNVTARGVFKTADSGRRVEIGTSGDAASMKFWPADTSLAPATLKTIFQFGFENFIISGVGSSVSHIQMSNQFMTFNGISSFSPIGTTSSTTATLNVGGGGGGWALRADGNVVVGSAGSFTMDTGYFKHGNIHLGWHPQAEFAGQIAIGTDTFGSETITLAGGNASIRFRQRTRGHNDDAHAWRLYGHSDLFWLVGNNIGFTTWREVSGALEWKVFGLPVIGGTILRIAGSAQIGPESSSADTKTHIVDLDLTGEANPLWKVKPKRFLWDTEKVANADEVNARLQDLGGMAGLIAEDVYAAMPDGVHLDEDGKPVSLEPLAIQAYVVDAIQFCRSEIRRLEALIQKGKK